MSKKIPIYLQLGSEDDSGEVDGVSNAEPEVRIEECFVKILSKASRIEADLSKYKYSEPLMIEYKPGTAGSSVRGKTSQENIMLSRGGDGVKDLTGLLRG